MTQPKEAKPSNLNIPNFLTALRIVLVPVFGWALLQDGGDSIQWRLIAFVVFVLLNSAGLIPPVLAETANGVSRWCLVTAIAGLGIKTSLEQLAKVGWRPVALMVGETVFLAILVLVAVLGFGVGH